MENKVELLLKTKLDLNVDLLNGEFEGSLDNWTINGTGWTYSYGKAINNSINSAEYIEQTINISPNVTYDIEIGLNMNKKPGLYTPGSVFILYLGNASYSFSSGGQYKIQLTPTSGTTIKILKQSGLMGNISFVRVTPPNAYEYDKIELYDDKVIGLNLSISEVEDITKRNITYSKTFTIPGTNWNNNLLKFLGDLNVDSPTIYFNKKNLCTLLYNDSEEMDGVLEITKSFYNEQTGTIDYEANVYSNIKTFSDTLSDNYITGNEDVSKDINFDEYNHYLNINTITNSWTATTGSGYYYPIVNYTNLKDLKLKVEDFRPALFAKEIFDKILAKAGYTYTSTFLNSEDFKSMIVPCSTDVTTDIEELNTRKFKAGINVDITKSKSHVTTNTTADILYITDTTSFQENDNYKLFDVSGTYDEANGRWVCSDKGLYKFNISSFCNIEMWVPNDAGTQIIKVQSKSATDAPKVRVNAYIYRRRGTVETQVRSGFIDFIFPIGQSWAAGLGWQAQPNGTFFTFQNSILSVNMLDPVECEVGDIIYVKYYLNNVLNNWYNLAGQALGNGYQVYARLKFFRTSPLEPTMPGFTFTNTPVASPSIYEGDLVKLSKIFPSKIKQIDFVTSIIKTFNLIVDVDKDNETNLIIDTRKNYFLAGKKHNWTSKVDRSKTFEIERIQSILDKNIEFSYTADADNLNKDYSSIYNDRIYGDKKIIRDGAVINDTFKVQTIFSPTPCEPIPGTNIIVPKIFATDNNNKITPQDFNIRLLYKTIGKQWESDFINANTTNNNYVMIYHKDGILQNIYSIYSANHFSNPYYSSTSLSPINDLNWDACNKYYQPIYPTYNTLYNTYWREYIEQLSSIDSKKLTCYIKLSELDIFNFSFADQVQIDEQYYIVNKIIDWVPGELTKVELLQLIEPVNPITDADKAEQLIRDWDWDDSQWYLPLRPPTNKYIGMQVIETNNTTTTNNYFERFNYLPESTVITGSTSGITPTNVTGVTENPITITQGNGINIGYGGFIESENFFVNGNNNQILGGENIFVTGEDNIIYPFTNNITVLGSNNFVDANVTNGVILGDNNNLTENNTIMVGGNIIFNSPINQNIHVITSIDNRFNRFKQAHVVAGGDYTEGVRTNRKSIDQVFVIASKVKNE